MATGRRTRLKIVETAPDPGEVAPVRPRSLGETLRAERERRNWKIPDLAQHLKIRRVHLEAIEAGRFNALPGPTYAVQFVRSYADVLGLDSGEMVRRFYAEVTADDLLGPMFNDVAQVDWSEHLPKLTAFWCRALLGHGVSVGSGAST